MLSKKSRDWLVEQGTHRYCLYCTHSFSGKFKIKDAIKNPPPCSRCKDTGVVKVSPIIMWGAGTGKPYDDLRVDGKGRISFAK